MCKRGVEQILTLFLLVIPSLAYGQASITGVVRDATGAVLPGATVEASSPALIEKVRSVLTDDTGQYRIENLRPGTYAVTFSLNGFSTVIREGVELSGVFVATINAELRVGAVAETITVTGESPIVDVQSTSRQTVMGKEIVDAIPSGRNAVAMASLVTGVQIGRVGDVGGVSDVAMSAGATVHGSDGGDARIESNGMSLTIVGGANQFSTGSLSATQEVTIDTSGASAEVSTGGVRVNSIPKEGGNRFQGIVFAAFTTDSFQSDNFDAALKATLITPNKVKEYSDFNPGLGGPIMRDRLWFFASYKYSVADNYAAGAFVNKNANNPNAWTYDPDLSSRPFNHFTEWDATVRLTWQATPRIKIGASNEEVRYCACSDELSSGSSPEAAKFRRTPQVRHTMVDFTMPLTSRLLLDGGALRVRQDLNQEVQHGKYAYTSDPLAISVTEQSLNNFTYRAPDPSFSNPPLRRNWWDHYQGRASLSYITGAHAVKSGFTYQRLHDTRVLGNQLPGAPVVSYRFNNGVPNQISLVGFPLRQEFIEPEVGVYVQDKWTINRLTANLGLRYEYHSDFIPAQTVGPTPLLPTRNITFPSSKPAVWHDVLPRLGAAYDLFGTGKTAAKVSVNRYLQQYGLLGRDLNPTERIGSVTTRSWNDADRDFVPDCELAAPAANGECGAMANQNFGGVTTSTSYDPELLNGWGTRGFNWEFSAGVQHEILPRVSVDASYFRRWYGNFWVTDNRAVSATDFTAFSLTAPNTDPRLPTAGQTISGYYNLNPDKVGQVANFITAASAYGKQTRRWNGVDMTVNARPGGGLILQGGISTGRTTTNVCEIREKVPEASLTNPFCDVETPWANIAKALATYTVPRVDLQVSGTWTSTPGPIANANYVASNAEVAPSLGRPLSGGAANTTVSLIAPNSLYANQVNILDLRVSKLLRFASTRTLVNLDVYNVLNSNAVLQVNQTFGGALPWQSPRCAAQNNRCDAVVKGRLFKISGQFDF